MFLISLPLIPMELQGLDEFGGGASGNTASAGRFGCGVGCFCGDVTFSGNGGGGGDNDCDQNVIEALMYKTPVY